MLNKWRINNKFLQFSGIFENHCDWKNCWIGRTNSNMLTYTSGYLQATPQKPHTFMAARHTVSLVLLYTGGDVWSSDIPITITIDYCHQEILIISCHWHFNMLSPLISPELFWWDCWDGEPEGDMQMSRLWVALSTDDSYRVILSKCTVWLLNLSGINWFSMWHVEQDTRYKIRSHKTLM